VLVVRGAGVTVDRDDYGEPIPAKVCGSCRRGEHMFCWGCGCPCNDDDGEDE
jgi:hypothetical protein